MSRRYPLSWPEGWPRTKYRQRARFGSRAETNDRSLRSLTIHAALRRLNDELARLPAHSIEISTNVAVRLDGLPYSDARIPADPGVAVYFKRGGKSLVLACDKWDRVQDNIAAIAAHIDALRGIERYGVGSLDRAFTGYEALPAPGQRDWRDVIRIDGRSPEDAGELRRMFAVLARQRHPDHGGDHAMMAELNTAYAEAQKEFKA